MTDIWTPGEDPNKPEPKVRQQGEGELSYETIEVTLCGHPYGETKETGMKVRVAKGAIMREVHKFIEEKRGVFNRNRGYVLRVRFAPSNEPDVWRPIWTNKVPADGRAPIHVKGNQ